MPSTDQFTNNGTRTTSLHIVLKEAIDSLNPTLPEGRRISYRSSLKAWVAGESWQWMQVINLAAKNYLLGHEGRIVVNVSTRLLNRRNSKQLGGGTLRLQITRSASAGRHVGTQSISVEPSARDLAFIVAVIRQAGGRIISGLKKPWRDPLVAEIPVK